MSDLRIAVVDYGMGNLHSVARALEKAGGAVEVVDAPAKIDAADLVVLPGVGNFGDAIARLEEKGLRAAIERRLADRRPYLGICLGMQMLLESSDEAPGAKGFARYPGGVGRFPSEIGGRRLIVPAIGWNRVKPAGANGARFFDGEPGAGAGNGEDFYFVHSYRVMDSGGKLGAAAAGLTEYGELYVSALIDPPLYATQFHPEKSGRRGIAFLAKVLAEVRQAL